MKVASLPDRYDGGRARPFDMHGHLHIMPRGAADFAGQATEASMGGSTPAINRIATTTARAMR